MAQLRGAAAQRPGPQVLLTVSWHSVSWQEGWFPYNLLSCLSSRKCKASNTHGAVSPTWDQLFPFSKDPWRCLRLFLTRQGMEINRTEPGNFWPGFPVHVTLTSACLCRLEEFWLQSFIPLCSWRRIASIWGKGICLWLEPSTGQSGRGFGWGWPAPDEGNWPRRLVEEGRVEIHA